MDSHSGAPPLLDKERGGLMTGRTGCFLAERWSIEGGWFATCCRYRRTPLILRGGGGAARRLPQPSPPQLSSPLPAIIITFPAPARQLSPPEQPHALVSTHLLSISLLYHQLILSHRSVTSGHFNTDPDRDELFLSRYLY